jgi:rRNA maturation endonuclease Nob1
MELWAHQDDVLAIRQFIEESRAMAIKELGADAELINQVFDPSKPDATCPACGSVFGTSTAQCPDCGLNFGG